MRAFRMLLLVLAACGGRATPTPTPSPAPPPAETPPTAQVRRVTLSIVGINDVHGNVRPDPTGKRGGLALLGGYLANLRAARAADGGAVIVLDGGDAFQGTLESNMNEGASVIAAYNTLGVDAMTLGNHEFDYGPVGPSATPRAPGDDPRGAIKARAAEAKFPVLAANTIDLATQRPVDWPNVQPAVILDRAGLKIGVIGLITLDTPYSTMAANVVGLEFAPLGKTMNEHARALRKRGANVVLVVAHAGGRCNDFSNPADLSSCVADAEMWKALAEVEPGVVDAVVAGHSHAGVAHLVNGTPVIEAFSYGVAFGRVDLLIENDRVVGHKLHAPRELCTDVNDKLRCDPKDTGPRQPATYEGRPIAEDAQVAAVLAPYIEKASVQREEKLGVKIETTVKKAYGEESALGNLVADLIRQGRPGADVGITNGGGLRADLDEGDLTYGKVYQLIPFDNRYARVTMTGAELGAIMKRNIEADRGILSISGVRVEAVCKGKELVVTLRRDKNGKVVKPKDKLIVATSDFLLGGGNDGVMGGKGPSPEAAVVEDVLIRETVVALLKKRGGTLRGDDPKLLDPAKPRLRYPGKRPVTCGAGAPPSAPARMSHQH